MPPVTRELHIGATLVQPKRESLWGFFCSKTNRFATGVAFAQLYCLWNRLRCFQKLDGLATIPPEKYRFEKLRSFWKLENDDEEVFAGYSWFGGTGHGGGTRLRSRSCGTAGLQGAPDGRTDLRLERLLHRRQWRLGREP